MNSAVDDLLVALALLASAAYTVSALGPRGLRQRLFASLAHWTARAPAFFGLRRITHRLTRAAIVTPVACGGCGHCGSAPAPKPPVEVKVSVARIGRR